MAQFIEAVTALGPRIQLNPTVTNKKLSRRLALATGLRPSQVMQVLMELHDALIDYSREGTPLRLDGIGRFTPSVNNAGRIRILYRADPDLRRVLRDLADFEGEILNRENIGLGSEQYKALWDAMYPEDPLELPRLQRTA